MANSEFWSKRKVLANFNVFVPHFLFWTVVVAPYIAIAVANISSIIFRSPLPLVSEGQAYFLVCIFVALILIYRAKKIGLSPSSRLPKHEKDYRKGHLLVATANFLAIIAFTTPFFLAYLYNNPELTLYEWYAMPFIGIGVILWIIGLISVGRSRA